MTRALLAAALILAIPCADASQPRSHAAKAAFQRLYHCPATDKPRGPCPGYQIDHVEPLCAGGADDLLNMQWLTVEAHRVKTVGDVRRCALLRRTPKSQ